MKRLNTFFYVFKKSAFTPSYYNDVIKAPFSFSFKYFLFLFLVLSLLNSLTLSFFLVQKAAPYLKKVQTELPKLYPSKLELKITQGEVIVNISEPYFIPLKSELLPQEISRALQKQPIQNLLVIDTQARPLDIKKYQTFGLLTKNHLAYLSDENEIRIQDLSEIKNFTINDKIVKTAWQKITPYFKWLVPALIVFLILFLPPLTVLGKFFYLALFSLLTWALATVFKRQLGYTKSLQINLQAITLPTIIVAAFQLLGTSPKIPFFQTIVLLIFGLIIITSLKPVRFKKKTSSKKK